MKENKVSQQCVNFGAKERRGFPFSWYTPVLFDVLSLASYFCDLQ